MYICVCVWYICVFAHGYTYGLIDMRIYVFVSACACYPFLSDILTRPQYFFISFTLLIVLLYCYVLWCCTFATGQPLTLIKMMNWKLLQRPDAAAISPTNSSTAFNEIRTLTGWRPHGSAGLQQLRSRYESPVHNNTLMCLFVHACVKRYLLHLWIIIWAYILIY